MQSHAEFQAAMEARSVCSEAAIRREIAATGRRPEKLSHTDDIAIADRAADQCGIQGYERSAVVLQVQHVEYDIEDHEPPIPPSTLQIAEARERARRDEVFQKAASAAAASYKDCLTRAAGRMAADGTEPAQVIAEAAFTSCAAQGLAIERMYGEHDGLNATGLIDKVNARLTGLVYGAIIAARAHPVAPVENKSVRSENQAI